MDFDRSRYRTYRMPFHSLREASRIEQYLASVTEYQQCSERMCTVPEFTDEQFYTLGVQAISGQSSSWYR